MATDYGKLNFAVSFNRTSAFPLEANSYFESLSEAQTAAASAVAAGSSDSAYYIGQLITVYDVDAGAVALYQIQSGGTLLQFGTATNTEELTALIDAVSARVTTLETTVGDEASGLVKGVADNASAIEGLDTRLTTAESDIDSLETRATSLETRATSAEGRLDTAESDIDELQSTVNNLTGAFVYRGVSTTDPTSSTGPTVSDYAEAWKTGDVVVYGVTETYTDADGDSHTVTTNKEYVYNGSTWREIGDEGSHLTKSEAAQTYVEQTHTVNGHALSGSATVVTGSDIAVSDSDTTSLESKIASIESSIADTNTAIDNAIGALDATVDGLGVGQTITALSETDGVISATVEDIAITHDQVTDFTDTVDSQIDAKINALDVSATVISSNETVASISETDGKISVTKQSISNVPQSSIVGLPDALAARVNYTDLSSEFSVDGTSNAVSVNEISANKIKVAESDGTTIDLDSKIDEIEATLAAVDEVDIDVIQVNGTALSVSDKTVNIPLSTASQAGVVISSSAVNRISVGTDGLMTLNSIDASQVEITNIPASNIVQDSADVLIIDGGTAAA